MKNQIKKPHLVYIITQGSWGGAQRYIYDLAKALCETYIITIIYGGEDTTLERALKDVPVDCHQMKSLHRSIHIYQDILAYISLRKLFHTLKPDIVHLNSTKAGIIGTIASYRFPHTVVYTVHGWVFAEEHHALIQWLYIWLERITQYRKDIYIYLSQKEKNMGIETLKLPETKCVVIPNGISPIPLIATEEKQQEAIKDMNKKRTFGKKVCITIGNFYPNKGIDILIQAIARIDVPTHYFVVGEGSERLYIEQLIHKYNLELQVTLLGEIKDASSLLPFADIVIIPSRKEGLPYVLLEALLAGNTIVTTDVGGIKEVITQHDISQVYIAQSSTPKLLRKQIIYALSSHIALHSRLPDQYHTKQLIKKTNSIYDTLLHINKV